MSKNDNLTFDFDYIHALYSYITSVKAYSVQKQAMDIYGLNEKNLQDSYNFIKKALGTISVENIAEQNKIFMSFDEKNLETMPASFLDAENYYALSFDMLDLMIFLKIIYAKYHITDVAEMTEQKLRFFRRVENMIVRDSKLDAVMAYMDALGRSIVVVFKVKDGENKFDSAIRNITYIANHIGIRKAIKPRNLGSITSVNEVVASYDETPVFFDSSYMTKVDGAIDSYFVTELNKISPNFAEECRLNRKKDLATSSIAFLIEKEPQFDRGKYLYDMNPVIGVIYIRYTETEPGLRHKEGFKQIASLLDDDNVSKQNSDIYDFYVYTSDHLMTNRVINCLANETDKDKSTIDWSKFDTFKQDFYEFKNLSINNLKDNQIIDDTIISCKWNDWCRKANEIIRHAKEYPYQPESEDCSIPQTESDILKSGLKRFEQAKNEQSNENVSDADLIAEVNPPTFERNGIKCIYRDMDINSDIKFVTNEQIKDLEDQYGKDGNIFTIYNLDGTVEPCNMAKFKELIENHKDFKSTSDFPMINVCGYRNERKEYVSSNYLYLHIRDIDVNMIETYKKQLMAIDTLCPLMIFKNNNEESMSFICNVYDKSRDYKPQFDFVYDTAVEVVKDSTISVNSRDGYCMFELPQDTNNYLKLVHENTEVDDDSNDEVEEDDDSTEEEPKVVLSDDKDIEKEEKTSETTEVVNKSQEVESDDKNIVSKNSDNLEKSNVTTNVSEPKKKTVRKKSLSRKSVSVIIPKKTNMNDDDDESCGFTGNSPPR